MNQPSSFQRFQPSNSSNHNLKRIEVTKALKNGEIELPIVNNSEQTNVKKIISRLLSQNSTSGGAGSAGSGVGIQTPVVSTSSSSNQQNGTYFLKKKIEQEFINPNLMHPIEK